MALSGSVFEIWHVTDRQTDRQTSALFHDMATRSGPHNNHITHTISISMHGYNKVSNTLYKQWQCIIQLLLPIPCWCINCESYVRILYAVMYDARPSLFYLCGLVCGLAVLWNSSRTRHVRSRCHAWRLSVAIYLCGLVCGLAVRF